MASSDPQYWHMIRDPVIFEEIMLMVGLDSLESLDSCRLVCKTWNVMIMENIWENPRNRDIMKMKIEKNWGHYDALPSEEEVSHAKWLGRYMKRKRGVDSYRNYFL